VLLEGGGASRWEQKSQALKATETVGHSCVAAGWLARIGVKTLYIKPGGPSENGYCNSFNSKLRDELLNVKAFITLREAHVLIE
jgi:integrase-like protein